MKTVPVFPDQGELNLQPGLFLFLPEYCLDGNLAVDGSESTFPCDAGEPMSAGEVFLRCEFDIPASHSVDQVDSPFLRDALLKALL